jgi:hypothetical protein
MPVGRTPLRREKQRNGMHDPVRPVGSVRRPRTTIVESTAVKNQNTLFLVVAVLVGLAALIFIVQSL